MKPTTKRVPFFAVGLALALALSISIGQGLGQEAGTGGEPAAPDQPSYVYLPAASKAPNTIFGHVTDDGVAAVGVDLDLWFYNGSTWSNIMETTTDANGDYFFRDMPALAAGQRYGVEYLNEADPNRLYIWDTRQLDYFPNMSNVNIGNFDIANVEATSPVSGTLFQLPGNFQWTPRPATPSDSYAFETFDISDNNPLFTTTPLGYVGSYNLGSLPANFQYCIPYFWGITVYSPDGGSGFSYWAYLVTLYNAAPSGIHGCVSNNGSPVSGVLLQLCRLPGLQDCNIQGTVTTNAQGYFAFTGKPTLNPGEEYYVRYGNNSSSSRLRYYETQTLSTYTSGSSVHIGDFDIANIPLGSPNQTVVPLPVTFWWTSRPNTKLDDYVFILYDPVGGDPWFWTDRSLGYVDHYNLQVLPDKFILSTPYLWEIWVFDLFNGYGISYKTNVVTFSSTSQSLNPAVPGLKPEVELQMRERMRSRASSRQQEGITHLRLQRSLEPFQRHW